MTRFPYSLTIAIPAYNEAESLRDVVNKAVRAGTLNVPVFEILIVNDGSTDRTGEIADELARANNHVKVIHHPKNRGFSGAIKTCYTKGGKELLFLIPADGQIDPLDVKIFLEAIGNADVVVGYRENNPEPLFRRFNSFVFHTIYRLLFGVKLREISTSILWRTSVLRSIDITASAKSALIEPEVIYKAWRAGFRFAQVPVPYYPRTGGVPKGSNIFMIIETIKELLRLRFSSKLN
jgi:glycosyltransferase involved in cell wall biosynthesis